jgi:hypothetical protein
MIKQLDQTETGYSLCYLGNNTLLAGTGPNGRIYQSLDAGLSWNQLAILTAGSSIRSLTHLGNGAMLAGDNLGNIWKSYV